MELTLDSIKNRLPLFKKKPASEQLDYGRILINYAGEQLDQIPTPVIEFLTESEVSSADIENAERIIQAYNLSTRDSLAGNSPCGLWETFSQFQQNLAKALESGDALATAKILARMFVSPATTGLAMGDGEFEAVSKSSQYSHRYSLMWKDKVVSLANAVGAFPVVNPEQQKKNPLQTADPIELLNLVESIVGCKIAFPQVGCLFGVRFRNHVLPLNFLYHFYSAYRIRSLLKDQWAGLEIGGGVGGLAAMSGQFGARRFCVIDLPVASALQAYFLLNSPLKARVTLFGESAKDNSIELLPPSQLNLFKRGDFDVVVNQDSLPEMSESVAISYLKKIEDLKPKYFLSINQESLEPTGPNSRHGWVLEQTRQHFLNSQMIYRAPYWLRSGYVEELYTFS